MRISDINVYFYIYIYIFYVFRLFSGGTDPHLCPSHLCPSHLCPSHLCPSHSGLCRVKAMYPISMALCLQGLESPLLSRLGFIWKWADASERPFFGGSWEYECYSCRDRSAGRASAFAIQQSTARDVCPWAQSPIVPSSQPLSSSASADLTVIYAPTPNYSRGR